MTTPAGGPAHDSSRRVWLDTLWLVFPVAAIVLCYAPTWVTEYGFSEDYRLLSFYDHGATNRTLMIAEGRPINALWTNLVFGHLPGIHSLALVRLANVALLGMAAMLVSIAWRRSGLGKGESALAGTAVITLPPFQIVAAYAAWGAVPLSLVLAIAAALVTRGNGADRPAKSGLRLATAFATLTLAVLAYQPAAMMFWAIAGLLLLAPEHETHRLRRLARVFLIVGLAAMLAGFVAYDAGKWVWPAPLAGQGRASLSLNPIRKGLWFLTNPLAQSLNLWRLYPDRLLAVAVGLALEAGLAMRLLRRPSGRMHFAAALILLPLCYLPNLAVAEDWAAFRTQIALVSIVFFYAVISLSSLKNTTRRWVFPTVLGTITAMGLTLASRDVRRLCAIPQAQELAMVRRHMAGIPAGYRSIGVRMADDTQTFAPYALWDEFGRAAVSFPWGVASLPYLALREVRPLDDTTAIRVWDVTLEPARVDTVLDWGKIIADEKARSR